MSIVTLKRKSVIQYGTNRSAKPPGGYWLPQGPFGPNTLMLQQATQHEGPVGFSLNGPHRNVGYIGKESKFSKNGTPFRGTQPMGSGGTFGTYPRPEPVYNVNRVIVEGNQYQYIKPTVLTTYGMLRKKYRWIHSGQYPNYWVQPVYTGNQTDTSSQGLYVQNLAAANNCNLNVNNVGTYEGYTVGCGPTLCTPGRSTAGFKFNDMARNAPYTKTLYQPVSYGQYNLYLTRGCNNPIGPQKPFPYAVQTGTGIKTGGIRMTSVGNACGTSNIYVTPPAWYWTPTSTPNLTQPPQNSPLINQ